MVHGRLEEADQEVGRALTVSRGGGDPFHHALSLCLAGELKNFRGEFREASSLQLEGLRIAREHNLVFPILFGIFTEGITRTGMGDYAAARVLLEEGRTLAGKVGDEIWLHRILNCLGWCYLEVGDLQRATELNQEGAAGARRRGDPRPPRMPKQTSATSSSPRAISSWRTTSSRASIAWCGIPP